MTFYKFRNVNTFYDNGSRKFYRFDDKHEHNFYWCNIAAISDSEWYSNNIAKIAQLVNENERQLKEQASTFKLSKHGVFRRVVEGVWNNLKKATSSTMQRGGEKVSLLGRTRKIIRDGNRQYVMIKGVKTTLKQAMLLHQKYEKKKKESKGRKTRSR
jgi:hypothetical protein